MLECGCEPAYEGGYGDDGRSGRYSMEWCPVHKAALQLLKYLQRLLGVTELNVDDMEPETRAVLKEVAGLVADLEQEERTMLHDRWVKRAREAIKQLRVLTSKWPPPARFTYETTKTNK